MNIEKRPELKSILHSKRANIFYLQHCKVMQKTGRVLYLTKNDNKNLYYNIPIANTTCILLGNGTSITQAATKILAKAGVMIGFCGGGGTPLISAQEVEWISPQSEYRPTEYLQRWVKFWFDDNKRFVAAKTIQQKRIDYIRKIYSCDKFLYDNNIFLRDYIDVINEFEKNINKSENINKLLSYEGLFTKKIYSIISEKTNIDFKRNYKSKDSANEKLNHGNYLAYGLAASSTWVLGIPHSLAVLHGKTRRGGLVFDIADLVKDAIVLPLSFICASNEFTESEFRKYCLQSFIRNKSLDYMFEVIKEISEI